MPKSELSPTTRFSNRADDYAKFRPSYPEELFDFFEKELRLGAPEVIADIGSGTGMFSEPILKRGYPVIGVEPNDPMRASAEKLLSRYAGFRSVKGTAEATGLESGSVACVAAAQAFHWFEANEAKAEFKRILRPGGTVALVWNDRRVSTPFAKAYEAFLKHSFPDYSKVTHTNIAEEELSQFLGTHGYASFPNHQDLDFDSLCGRVASSSYAPHSEDNAFGQMKVALRKLFDAFQTHRKIRLEYDTKLYFSRW